MGALITVHAPDLSIRSGRKGTKPGRCERSEDRVITSRSIHYLVHQLSGSLRISHLDSTPQPSLPKLEEHWRMIAHGAPPILMAYLEHRRVIDDPNTGHHRSR